MVDAVALQLLQAPEAVAAPLSLVKPPCAGAPTLTQACVLRVQSEKKKLSSRLSAVRRSREKRGCKCQVRLPPADSFATIYVAAGIVRRALRVR